MDFISIFIKLNFLGGMNNDEFPQAGEKGENSL